MKDTLFQQGARGGAGEGLKILVKHCFEELTGQLGAIHKYPSSSFHNSGAKRKRALWWKLLGKNGYEIFTSLASPERRREVFKLPGEIDQSDDLQNFLERKKKKVFKYTHLKSCTLSDL